jgi:hypothetical protein
MLAIILLLLFSFQQPKPETVPLTFGPEPERIVIIKRSEAEKLYREVKKGSLIGPIYTREENDRLFAALTVALGTSLRADSEVPALNSRDRLDWEIRRGVRKPLQKPDPKERN